MLKSATFANVIKGFSKNVTVRDILSTYPYPNTLAVLEVNKNILKLALERAASYFENNNGNVTVSERFLKPKVEHYNYDYFSNINYTFDLTKEDAPCRGCRSRSPRPRRNVRPGCNRAQSRSGHA